MNRSDEPLFDTRIADWFEDDPHSAPDQALDIVLAAFPSIKQRRAQRAPWRYSDVTSPLKLAVAAAAIVVAVAGGAWLLGQQPGAPGVGGQPTPTPTPLASPTVSPTASQPESEAWKTYTSSQYGFTIGHPTDWTVDPAERAWDLEMDAPDWQSPAMDDFMAPTGDVRVSAWSVPLEPDTIVDETWPEVEAWIRQYCQKTGSESCAGILDQTVRLCVEVRDCHPGVLVAGAGRDVQAFFTGGIYNSRMVVVTIWRDEFDPSVRSYGGGRELIKQLIEPMCVWPEDERPAPGGQVCLTPRE